MVLVPPLLFPPPIRLQALVLGGATSNTSPLLFPGFLVFARCVGYEKALDFTRAGDRIACQPEMTKEKILRFFIAPIVPRGLGNLGPPSGNPHNIECDARIKMRLRCLV